MAVFDLALSPKSDAVFAATHGRGVWMLKLPPRVFRVTFLEAGLGDDAFGTVLTVDGVGYVRGALPLAFSWAEGTNHTFAWSPTVSASGTKRYAWGEASGLASTQSGVIRATGNGSITARFRTQFKVELDPAVGQVLVDQAPVTSLAVFWWDRDSTHSLRATSPYEQGNDTRRIFTGWSGDLQSADPAVTIQVTGPKSLRTSWRTQYFLTNNFVAGSLAAITPSPTGDSWYDVGGQVIVSLNNVWNVVPSRSRTNLISYFDGSTRVPAVRAGSGVTTFSFLMVAPRTVNSMGVTQYFLSVTGGGNVRISGSPTSDRWFDAGSVALITTDHVWNLVEGRSRLNLFGLVLDGAPVTVPRRNAGTHAVAVEMNSWRTLVFQSATQYFLGVSGGASDVRVNPSSPTGDAWFYSGTSVVVTVPYSWNQVSGQSRQNLVSWSLDGSTHLVQRTGAGTFTTPPIVMERAHAVSFDAITQFFLAMQGGGEVRVRPESPTRDRWYDPGTVVVASTNYVWNVLANASRNQLSAWQLDQEQPIPVSRVESGRFETLPILMTKPRVIVFHAVRQFFVDAKTAFGTVNGSGWHDAGSEVTIRLGPTEVDFGNRTRVQFRRWTGSSTAASPVITLTVDEHKRLVAEWARQYLVSTASTYSAPRGAGWYDAGTQATVSVGPIVDHGNETRRAFRGWQGDLQSASPVFSFTVSRPTHLDATWVTQYRVSVRSATGEPTGAGWHDRGSTITVRVDGIIDHRNNTRSVFLQWSGTLTGTTPAFSLTVERPHQLVAEWKTQYLVEVVSIYARPSGGGWFDAGSPTVISIDPVVDTGNGTRRVLIGWSGTDTQEARFEVQVSRPVRFEAQWKTQFLLQIESVAPAAVKGGGWYDQGATATVTANDIVSLGAKTRLVFKRWEGAVTGARTTMSVVLSGPTVVRAIWQRQHFLALTFADERGRSIVPVTANAQLGNGTAVVLRPPFTLWVPEGLAVQLAAVVYGQVDVAPVGGLSLTVTEPVERRIDLRIYDAQIRVVDPFGLPIGGAQVVVRLANATVVRGNTNSDGLFILPRIPLGTFDAQASNLGVSAETRVATPQPETQVLLPLSLPMVGTIGLAIASGAILALRRRLFGP